MVSSILFVQAIRTYFVSVTFIVMENLF